MRYITPFLFAVLSSPAWAASGPFVSLKNTNFIVLLSFLLFIGVLIYLKVPAMMGKLLDQRAEGIQADLDQARRNTSLQTLNVWIEIQGGAKARLPICRHGILLPLLESVQEFIPDFDFD